MTKREISTIVIFGLLGVISTSAVLYGIIQHNKNNREVTVAGACWEGKRVIGYEWDGPRECPPIEFPKDSMPLLVRAHTPNTALPDPSSAAYHAINFINQNLGYEVFELAESNAGATDVQITIGVARDNTWIESGGRAWHEKNKNGTIKGHIQTCNTVDMATLNSVLIHELLHILGLGHDDWPGSIMYSTQIYDPTGDIAHRRLWITDADREYLQRYKSH